MKINFRKILGFGLICMSFHLFFSFFRNVKILLIGGILINDNQCLKIILGSLGILLFGLLCLVYGIKLIKKRIPLPNISDIGKEDKK